MEFEKKKNVKELIKSILIFQTSNVSKEDPIESTRKTASIDNPNSGFKTSLRGYDVADLLSEIIYK